MNIGSKEWIALLREGSARLGLPITPEQAELMARHAQALLAWNRKTNLTSITAPEEVAIKHFADSVVPARLIPQGAKVLDIGSGGGFPGIPLKVIMPSLSVTLIDAVRKKVSFLKYVIRDLKLEKIEAHHIRAEDLAQRPAFDVVVCRALTALNEFAEIARPLVKPDGLMIALKAKIADEEVSALQKRGAERLAVAVDKYRLPVFDAERAIITLRKKDEI